MRGVTPFHGIGRAQHGFQPALPMRGVTQDNLRNALYTGISTRTPHAGSDLTIGNTQAQVSISTRTPHAGSDLRVMDVLRFGVISTRTPHAGSDRGRCLCTCNKGISTRTPHAGSDAPRGLAARSRSDFNPHSPCGE